MLIGVTEARSRATGTQLSAADLDDPAKVRAYNEAQSQLSSSAQRAARAGDFRGLSRAQGEREFPHPAEPDRGHREFDPGRRATIITTAVQGYNTRIRTFPDAIGAKIFYGAKPKVPFEAAAGSENAPKVDFNTAS